MVIFWLLHLASALDIDLDSTYELIKKNKVNSDFAPDFSTSSQCHPTTALYYPPSQSSSNLTLSSPTELLTTITLSSVSQFLGFSPENFEIRLSPEISQSLEFNYLCTSSGWGQVTLTISTPESNYQISWMKYCGTTGGFDWSLVILLIIALATVWVAAYSARNISFLQNHLTDDSDVLTTAHAFGFIIVGSLFLALLFFFMQYIGFVLEILICIGGVGAVISVIEEFKLERHWDRIVTLPVFGTLPAISLIITLTSISFVLLYEFTKNWVLSNVIGLCFAFTLIKTVKIPSFKVGGLLLSLAFVYDIFWVYFSSYIFGDNVMVTVASGLDLPIKLQFPHLGGVAAPQTCSMLGLGDLALPGLFLAFSSRFDHINNTKYLNFLMVCYGIALVMCVGILIIFKYPQPALLYISPMLVLGMLGLAYKRGEVSKVWKGITPSPLMNYEFPMEELQNK